MNFPIRIYAINLLLELMDLILSKFDPKWAQYYIEIHKFLKSHLKQLLIRTEHIGSTSVVGMVAKPILDIDLVIKKENFDKVKTILRKMGYNHMGDLGIKGRESFSYNSTPFYEHHLYVCDKDSEELRRHIAFREYLRKKPFAVKKYSHKKRQLLNLSKDPEKYILGKDQMVNELLTKALSN